MGPNGPLGQLTQTLGLGTLPFTFPGPGDWSLVYSLPFAVQPCSAHSRPSACARWKPPPPHWAPARWTVFLPWPACAPWLRHRSHSEALPIRWASLAVLMLGGNIPGVTRVVSVQIYDHVEALEYAQAHWLAGGMVLISSFVVLLCLNLTRRSSSAIS